MPALADDMRREFVAQFGRVDVEAMQAEASKPTPNRVLKVGGARYDITLRMTGAFGRTEAFANGVLLAFLRPLLGDDMQLSNFTVVAAHSGAPEA